MIIIISDGGRFTPHMQSTPYYDGHPDARGEGVEYMSFVLFGVVRIDQHEDRQERLMDKEAT
jgi:hypothetical protein